MMITMASLMTKRLTTPTTTAPLTHRITTTTTMAPQMLKIAMTTGMGHQMPKMMVMRPPQAMTQIMMVKRTRAIPTMITTVLQTRRILMMTMTELATLRRRTGEMPPRRPITTQTIRRVETKTATMRAIAGTMVMTRVSEPGAGASLCPNTTLAGPVTYSYHHPTQLLHI